MKKVIGKWLFWILTLCIFFAAMSFGVVKKKTYKDTLGQEDYLEHLLVGELTENSAEILYAILPQALVEAPVILRVEAVGEIEHLFNVDRQKVVVREVYAGTRPEAGEEVYLFSCKWQLSLDGVYDSLERGYVNILEVGMEYLVFAEDFQEDMNGDIPAIKLYGDYMLDPVFCYEERQNVVIPVAGEATFVPYIDVRNNEFFVTSEKALEILEKLKRQMLSLYPRS